MVRFCKESDSERAVRRERASAAVPDTSATRVNRAGRASAIIDCN